MAHFRRVVAASFDPFRDVKCAKKKLCEGCQDLVSTTRHDHYRDGHGTLRDIVPVCPEATEEQ